MNKVLKIFLRIVVVVVVLLTITFTINMLLKLKYNDNDKDNGEWNWEKESVVIETLLSEKYPMSGDNEYLNIQKNTDIPQKEKDEKRILVVGDSYVWGMGGTNINYLWWKQLDLIIKEAGYSNVNVYGASMYRFNTEEELELILKKDSLIEKIDPDLIIIGYVTNDPERHAEDGTNVIKEFWETDQNENELYKKNPGLYQELYNRLGLLGNTEIEVLKEIGDKLGFHRWDMKRLLITEGENLIYYKDILKRLDARMKEINVPYFFIQTDYWDNEIVTIANNNIYKLMDELNITMYRDFLYASDALSVIGEHDWNFLKINPNDGHPGIVWNSALGKKAYNILEENYKFIFENSVYQDINKLELNINDTMPFMDVEKLDNNTFKFKYPENEEKRTENSKLLYYPIEKEYVKLNLEYPKEISKIIINVDGLKKSEIYVNTIDKKYGFDVDDVYQKVTACKKINKTTFEVNEKITSVNISLELMKNSDRIVTIKFIE